MKVALFKSLAAMVPALMLLAGSLRQYSRGRRLSSLAQAVGAACFLLIVASHVCEALNWFPAMRWGVEDSVSHYLNLGSAIVGFTLFPLGYLLHAFTENRVP